jgi:uncharacterized protein YheU (UPF0270 family)
MSEPRPRQDPKGSAVVVPLGDLSPDALRGIVESFVNREGTDYGRDYSLEEKVNQVVRQLERGEARITFDHKTETINIVSHDD